MQFKASKQLILKHQNICESLSVHMKCFGGSGLAHRPWVWDVLTGLLSSCHSLLFMSYVGVFLVSCEILTLVSGLRPCSSPRLPHADTHSRIEHYASRYVSYKSTNYSTSLYHFHLSLFSWSPFFFLPHFSSPPPYLPFLPSPFPHLLVFTDCSIDFSAARTGRPNWPALPFTLPTQTQPFGTHSRSSVVVLCECPWRLERFSVPGGLSLGCEPIGHLGAVGVD